MGFKCGIVGLPNVGKSTLFNALTQAGIDAQNYPFCTIEPNTGIVPVPDSRLQTIADIVNPRRTLAATMTFVDIAGLVAGAAKGEGLGNQFLAHIRETQAIGHVVRCFENPDIVHVAGKIDPIADIEVINTELALADLETVEKALHKASKQGKSGDKVALAQHRLLTTLRSHLDAGERIRQLTLSSEEQIFLKSLNLLTAKPVLYIANVDENGFASNPYLDQVIEFAKKEKSVVVSLCAAIEAEITTLDEEDKKAFLADMGLKKPGLNRVIRAGYQLLNLQTYFTAGPKEVRAWTIPINVTAVEAAGVIHTDFAKGFIRAEVISYKDYIECRGEQGAKEAGKLRLEGKEYRVQDADVIHFRFNV